MAENFSLPGLSRDDLTALQYIVNDSNPDNLWNNLQAVHAGAQVGGVAVGGA